MIIFQNTGFYSNLFPFSSCSCFKCPIINVIHNDPNRGIDFFWHNRMRLQEKWESHIIKFIPRLLLGYYRKLNLKKESHKDIRYQITNSAKTILLSKHFVSHIPLNNTSYKTKIEVINNPNSFPINYVETDKENLILFVGRLTGNKQYDHVIKVWNRLAPKYKDWKLIILGDGDQMSFLQSLVKFPSQTIFKGICDPRDYYRKAKVFCMASCYEGWPMVLPEAMCNGCVPIAYNTFASISDIITDRKNGILIKAFDKNEYRNQLENLICDDVARIKLAHSATLVMEHFSPSVIANQWILLFNKILRKKL